MSASAGGSTATWAPARQGGSRLSNAMSCGPVSSSESSVGPVGRRRPASWIGTCSLPEDAPQLPPLPDLTEHLKRSGVYEQYTRWREGYLRFRRGEPNGAAGEITTIQPPVDDSLPDERDGLTALNKSSEVLLPPVFADPDWAETVRNGTFMNLPEFRYPRVDVFRFHRTASYWTASAYLEGSIMFTITSAFGYLEHHPRIAGHKYQLVTVPNFIASGFYVIGCYLSYFQLINMKNKDDPSSLSYVSCSISSMRAYAAWESVGAVVIYLLGALVFQVNVTGALFTFASFSLPDLVFVKMMNVIGCLCFVVGAVFEALHNKSTPLCSAAVCVCVTFFFGSIGFFASSIAELLELQWWAHKAFVTTPLEIGSALFTIGAIAQFAMWKDEQFGGALMRDLNTVPAALRMAHNENGFSWRGIAFQILYTTTASMSILSLCFSVGELTWQDVRSPGRVWVFVHEMMDDVVFACLAHIILLFHSHVPRLPHRQPWRIVGQAFRLTSIIACSSCICQYIGLLYADEDIKHGRHVAARPSEPEIGPLVVAI